MSGTDLSQLSDSVLQGNSDITQLPTEVRGQLMQYWQGMGVNFGDPNVARAQLNDITNQAQQQTRAAQNQASGWTQALNVAFKPVSFLGSLGHWLYSNTVSPALSFTALEAHSMMYGQDGTDQSFGAMWNKAHYVSPGQSIWELGMNNAELKNHQIDPQDMMVQKELQAKGQYFGPRTVNNPWGNKTAADLYFNSGWAKGVTGTLDLASSWYLDPLTKVGKVAEIAKIASYTKPVSKVFAGAEKLGGTPEEIGARLAENPTVQQVSNKIMDIKAANQGTGTTTFKLRTQIGALKDNPSGDALASLLAAAKDQDEVNRVLRIGMGDSTALGNTLARQDELAARVASLRLAVTNTDSQVNRLLASGFTQDDPVVANALADQQRFKNLLAAHINEQGLIDKQREVFGSVKNLNYNQTLSNVANGPTAQFLANKGDFVLKKIGSPFDVKATGWIDVHDPTSWRQVDASLKEVPGLDDATRQNYVGAYMNANANQRGQILLGIEQGAVNHMVNRYNTGKAADDQISASTATKIFQDYQTRRSGQIQSILNGRTSYTPARIAGPNGGSVPADVYTNPNIFDFSNTGEALVADPILETQLENHHVMMDFKGMSRALKVYGSDWSTATERAQAAIGKTIDITDRMNHYWKALQLIRPAYMPRALTDDFLGQVARFGALAMAQRAIQGGKMMAQDYWLSAGRKSEISTSRAAFAMNEQHLEELGRQEQAQITKLDGMTPGTPEHDFESDKLEGIQTAIEDARNKSLGLSNLMAGTGDLPGGRWAAFRQIRQLAPGTRQVQIGRDVFSAPYGGYGGQLARDSIAGTRFAEMVNSDPANFYLRQLRQMRQIGYGTITNKDREIDHLMAWSRDVRDQIAQSYVGKLALKGWDADKIANDLRTTAAGQQFVRDMGLKHRSEADLAQRVVAHVNTMLDPALPGVPEIRQALLDGNFSMNMLKQVPKQVRPDVHGELWDYAIGKHPASGLIDQGISKFYQWMGDTPSTRLLRNPLFKQEYQAHLAGQVQNRQTQGIDWITQDERGLMEDQARKFAIQQVKKFTYNMDHETKMQYAMRNWLAFLGPTSESWMRWGRIISEKPQTLGKIVNAYNAPTRAGIVTDGQGNKVDADGYMTDPTTGQKTFVPIGQRTMTIQVPDFLGGKFLAKHLGMPEGANFKLPMSSMMMVMTEGDGIMPVGAGPIVNIPLNHFMQSRPEMADWAQKVGLLPYGPQSDWSGILPAWVKKTVDAFDDSTQSRQNGLGYLMQAETMKYNAGLRTTRPTWQELQDKADRFALAKAVWSAFSPFSGDQADPYQFFRDDYRRMQTLDPKSADEKFLEKYGESFYAFTEAMNKNNAGLAPTVDAVRLSQQFKDLNDKTGGKYAGLIVGDEANNGTYSNGAYYYEKNTPMATGSTTMMRSGLSAREAWQQMNVNKGWADYNQVLTQLNAQLIQRGLKSYSDKGASDLDQIRKNAIYLLTNKYKQDGTDNPLYNPDFAAAWGQQNKDKYNQTANELEQIVSDPAMWAKAYDAKTNTVGVRSDIYSLRAYLTARDAVMRQLDMRAGQGGSSDINAKSNDDLRIGMETLTNSLIEQDTKFQDLHTRYFANDMGYNTTTSPVVAAMIQQEAAGQTQSLTGQTGQFDTALRPGEVGSIG